MIVVAGKNNIAVHAPKTFALIAGVEKFAIGIDSAGNTSMGADINTSDFAGKSLCDYISGNKAQALGIVQ